MKRFVSIGECMVEMSADADSTYRLGFAGDTLNTAWYARALLPDGWQVDYVTALGDDTYSAQLRDFLGAHRIGVNHIQTISGKRIGLYLIHQADGDRQFTYWRDSSAARQLADDREALDKALLGAGMIYFSGITLAILAPRARGRLLKAIVTARDAGAQIAFDPNIRPALWPSTSAMRAVITAGASIADIVLPTHGDEKSAFGDIDGMATAARYRDGGSAEVVVKDGAGKAFAVTDDECTNAAPEPGAIIIDATGAGDAFNGAYLAARLRGRGAENSLIAAHDVARAVIARNGALLDLALLPEV